MRQRLTHDQLCNLVEIELSPEEEWTELYREWKQQELKDLWLEVKRIEHSYLRRLSNRRNYVEQSLGIRLNVRVPKSVVRPPVTISRSLDIQT